MEKREFIKNVTKVISQAVRNERLLRYRYNRREMRGFFEDIAWALKQAYEDHGVVVEEDEEKVPIVTYCNECGAHHQTKWGDRVLFDSTVGGRCPGCGK